MIRKILSFHKEEAHVCCCLAAFDLIYLQLTAFRHHKQNKSDENYKQVN